MTATVTDAHEGLRAGREAAGLFRPDIAKMTGLSIAVVARIETRGGTAAEITKYREALTIALGNVVVADSEEAEARESVTRSPAVTGFLGGKYNAQRLTHWDGLERGDLVRITGEQGQFKFLFFYTDDRGPDFEYVEVSGPMVHYKGTYIGTRIRSIRVDRLIRSGKKRKHGQR